MMIQSVSKSVQSVRVVVKDVAGQTDEAILTFAQNEAKPNGYMGDHRIRRTEDLSGGVTGYDASVVFWTD